MFSSSFTMSEHEHRQWTPYKHDAPALNGPLRSGTSCRPLRSRIWNLRSDLQIWVRGRREKCCAGNQNKAQHALPQERKRAKGENRYATQVQMRSQVDQRPVSGEMSPAELPDENQFRRASLLLP
jgi:hypothetical protein